MHKIVLATCFCFQCQTATVTPSILLSIPPYLSCFILKGKGNNKLLLTHPRSPLADVVTLYVRRRFLNLTACKPKHWRWWVWNGEKATGSHVFIRCIERSTFYETSCRRKGTVIMASVSGCVALKLSSEMDQRITWQLSNIVSKIHRNKLQTPIKSHISIAQRAPSVSCLFVNHFVMCLMDITTSFTFPFLSMS